jgi:hypothetical protein
MRKFIVFVESNIIAQACSTNKTLFSVLRHGEEEELFLYLCKCQINVHVEKRMALRKKDVLYNILAVSYVPCQDLVQFFHIAMCIRTVRILVWDDNITVSTPS